MNTLTILREVNIASSALASVVTLYLLYKFWSRYRAVTGTQKRITGAALLGVASLFFINSTLLLTTFIAIAISYNAEFVSTFSNVRILTVNILTIIVSFVILLIERGKL